MRNMHRWAAHGMVAMVWLHMIRVFLTGAYKKPREFNWVIGGICGLLTVFLSYTGYLLPWDQLAFWGVKVGTEIAKIAPGGEIVRGILLGDNEVGAEALIRFYVLHVAILPTILAIFIGIHFFRIRKDGGLACPPDTSGEKLTPIEDCGTVRNNSVFKSARSYQLVEVVQGSEPKVNEEVNNMVFSWPKLVVREAIVLFLVLAILSIVSARRPGRSGPSDQPLQGPLVLPRPPGTGELQCLHRRGGPARTARGTGPAGTVHRNLRGNTVQARTQRCQRDLVRPGTPAGKHAVSHHHIAHAGAHHRGHAL
jgi:quinol-cytochrome oxidoreductase complex cytochrome b subunit